MFVFDITRGLLKVGIKAISKPEIAQKKNAEFISESIITFFINIASVPEKIRAKTLNKIAFEPDIFLLNNTKVPKTINKIPINSFTEGYSFNKNIPRTSATTGL